MRRVRRDEILDWATYSDARAAFRARVWAAKAPRRVHVGEYLTFLFENPLTVQYQIQEMILAERIVRETEIQHEIDTYNGLLGADRELGCTLLVEIEAAAERDAKLRAWWALPENIFMVLEDGREVRARFDASQRGDGQLSAVQYLKFAVGDGVPAGIAVRLPDLDAAVTFDAATRQALANDLAGIESAPAG
jgi:hypothetical protein